MMQDQPDHQPWYIPRTAEIIQRGGEGFANAIGAGLQQFAQGVANGVMQRAELKRQQEEKDKEDAKTFRTYVAMGEQLGLDKTALQNAGVAGAKGIVEGHIAKQKFDEFAQQIAERKARMEREQMDASAMAQFQNSYRNVTTPMQIPAGTFGPMSRAETIGGQPLDERGIFDLGMKSRLNPNQLGDVLKAYGDVAKSDRPAFQMPTGARVTGGTVGPNGPSLQFTTEPNRLGEKPERIFLKDGTPTQKAMYSDGSIVDLPTDRAHALTDAQANALQFSERMAFNNKVLSDLESAGFDATSAVAAAQKWTPNFLTGDKFQSYDAARKNWIAAVLRKESGAAISKSEEKGALEQYFPAFGDAPSVVKQKAELRALAETNMRRAIGGIENQAGAAAPKSANRFDDEAAARKAGAKPGDIIELYDPATASYRKARLK